MRDHRKLDVFQLAHQLAKETYRVTENFPRSELYGLRKQIRTAAVSVPTNIVEGAARDSPRDYARFLNIAFGSLRELEYLVELAGELAFISRCDCKKIHTMEARTARKLIGLIRGISNLA